MRTLKTIITAILLLFTASAFGQTKEEALEWMRSHLKTVVIHNNDSLLPYTMTKTYTFYDDALVVKTVKNFYKDTSLNSPPLSGRFGTGIFIRKTIPPSYAAYRRSSRKRKCLSILFGRNMYIAS